MVNVALNEKKRKERNGVKEERKLKIERVGKWKTDLDETEKKREERVGTNITKKKARTKRVKRSIKGNGGR